MCMLYVSLRARSDYYREGGTTPHLRFNKAYNGQGLGAGLE